MRNKLLFSSFFISFLALISTPSFLAQGIGDRNRPSSGGTHVVSGKVRLPDGSPAVGARVTLNNTDIGSSNQSTDHDGEFSFSGMPEGNYSISVKLEGYQTESESFTIERFSSAGQGTQMAFVLRQPGQPKADAKGTNLLLKDVPKDAVSKYEKGMEKASKEDTKAAIADFDSAIAVYPNFAAAYYEKGAALLKTNDLDNAVVAFVKAIQLKPDYEIAFINRGNAYLAKGEPDRAIADYSEAIQLDPKNVFALSNRGASYEGREICGLGVFLLWWQG